MRQIGLFEAKTNLSKIAEAVARTGEAVTVTRRGKPYVDLIPHRPATPARLSMREVLDAIEKIRKTLPKTTQEEIRAAIEEGRR